MRPRNWSRRLTAALPAAGGTRRIVGSFADIAARHRAALATQRRRVGRACGVRGLRRRGAGGGVRRDRARRLPRDLRSSLRLRRAVSARDRRPHRAPARAGGRAGAHLRPLESRLQHADRIVLGGLVEGTWPPQTRPDPWLSRPMRHTLGLDLPERRISLSAHDFAQALGAREVMLSYPAKLSGAPTVVSRFVQRLAAVAGERAGRRRSERGASLLPMGARARPARHGRAHPRPEPKPPRAARPPRCQ